MAASTTTDRTVLIAIDASPHAKNAFEWYLSDIYRPNDLVVVVHITEAPHLPSMSFRRFLNNVHRPNDLIYIVHVPETPDLPIFSLKEGMGLPVDEWKTIMEEQMTKVQQLQKDYEFELVTRKVAYKMDCEHQDKNPGQGIIRTADENNAKVIVMGTRGLDALRRTLLGSVSDYVVRHAKVPVIICPMNKE